MRILVVSNFYPPHAIGGYELGCHDVVMALRARGHSVCVLTSDWSGGDTEKGRHGEGETRSAAFGSWLLAAGSCVRALEVDLGWDFTAAATGWRLARKELRNRRAFARAVTQFQPDLVYIWSLRYCSAALAMQSQRLGLPTCLYVSDDWLATWDRRDRWAQIPRNPARRIGKRLLNMAVETVGGRSGGRLAFRHIQCTSAYIEQLTRANGRTEDVRVIHWGVDMARFALRPAQPVPPLRALYVGQLVAHKGVHTAIEACARLVAAGYDLALTIVGTAHSAEYLGRLQALAAPLGERVRFTGGLPREQVAAIYAEHELLLFPSLWQEPFSIGLLEAMAAGLAVVATATGGSAEILANGENALTFAAGSVAECAAALVQLYDDPGLYERLRLAGCATISERFQLESMVEAIDRHLQQVCNEQR